MAPRPNPRPVVFTIDNHYIKPLAVALAGLKRYGTARRKIYLFYEHLHPIYRWTLKRWLQTSNLELVCHKLCTSHKIDQLPHHFTTAILLRLMVSKWIKESEYIYLDADVIILSGLESMDRFHLGDILLAASPRPLGRTHLPGKNLSEMRQKFSGRPYFATGLLLINRCRFEAEKVGERCLRILAKGGFDYPDQDALNLVCQELSWISLPQGVSVEVDDRPRAENQFCTAAQRVGVSAPCVVLQLAGSEKPWHFFNRHPLRKEFADVLRTTPLAWLPYGISDIRWRSLGSRGRRWLMRRILAGFAGGEDDNRS